MIAEEFQYKNIHGEFKKRDLAPCLDLLCKANVVHKIQHSAGNGIPLGAEANFEWFKLILVDIALCQAALGFDLSTWFLQPGMEFINRGSIADAFVGQELLCYSNPHQKTDLYFWKRPAKSSTAEVDYLYEHNRKIIPIEVKSGDGRTLKSMLMFLEAHPESPYGVRFSAQNYSEWQKIDSRPLYAVSSMAHEEQEAALENLLKD
jgi:predicted AAA+ superfamily ATPase